MHRTLLVTLIFLPFLAFTQIQVGGEEQKVETKKEKSEKKEIKEPKVASEEEAPVEVYLGSNYSNTFRRLEVNEGLFGDSLGARVDETALTTYSFEIGLRTYLNDFLEIDAGLSFLQNGEQYEFSGTDTLFRYINTYRYIGMPIKLNYVRGDAFKVFGGIGIMPQMAINRSYFEETKDAEGERLESTTKTITHLNSFVLSVVGDLGVRYTAKSGWGVYVNLLYRQQLLSSYTKTFAYKHFGNAIGASFGITRTL